MRQGKSSPAEFFSKINEQVESHQPGWQLEGYLTAAIEQERESSPCEHHCGRQQQSEQVPPGTHMPGHNPTKESTVLVWITQDEQREQCCQRGTIVQSHQR